jgi:hypothetical protein
MESFEAYRAKASIFRVKSPMETEFRGPSLKEESETQDGQ